MRDGKSVGDGFLMAMAIDPVYDTCQSPVDRVHYVHWHRGYKCLVVSIHLAMGEEIIDPDRNAAKGTIGLSRDEKPSGLPNGVVLKE